MDLELMSRDPRCTESVQRAIHDNPKLRFNILVADDQESDRLLTCLALLRSPCLHLVCEVWNGEEIVKYLNGEGEFADRDRYPFPDLLITDLQMPRMNGMEVLEWLQRREFSGLSVVVLSSALTPAVKQKLSQLGADYCAEKTSKHKEIVEFVARLEKLMVCPLVCPEPSEGGTRKKSHIPRHLFSVTTALGALLSWSDTVVTVLFGQIDSF